MNKNWHSITIGKTLAELNSNETGISSSEAASRLEKIGRNLLPEEKPEPKLKLFLRQFNNPLIYILIAAIIISLFLSHFTDSIFIAVVLLINTTIGFYQENKAGKSLLALKKMVEIKANVLRDGAEKEINSKELVPGDIVLLKAGDKIPGDGRILEAQEFKVNEAALTGEFFEVEKSPCETREDAPLHARPNMVYMGTIVENGWAKIIIVSTGMQTQIGKITALLKKTKKPRTPLQQKIEILSRITGLIILLFIILIVLVGFPIGKSFDEIFLASLALAVSAIPEGLLPAITVILVLGMRRIFKKKGLIRKLSSAEILGSVTVICTDKTGTLTKAEMKVSHIFAGNAEIPEEKIKTLAKQSLNNKKSPPAINALKIAVLANAGFIENPESTEENWIIRGRPTEKALLFAGLQAGINKNQLEKRYPILERINFESKLKYAATLHSLKSNKKIIFAIGAPEIILSKSLRVESEKNTKKLNKSALLSLTQKYESFTRKGLRVLACAYSEINREKENLKIADLMENLTFTGFIALDDPLRDDVIESVNITKKAGIRTILVTGDHLLTAQTIAKKIGLKTGPKQALEGQDLDLISDFDLINKVKEISIFARVSPHHKLKIVKALQANGEIVAMLGDGVNDAPALKASNIGVALGSGTDVAKEAADLILLNGSFQTIVEAIKEGRIIFENIRKVFTYLIADDFSELFLFLGSMAMGFPIPLLPAQILWINLVEDSFPDIALTTEREEKGIMDVKPKNSKEQIINNPLKKWMAAIFIITGSAAFLSFLYFWNTTGDLRETRTLIFALMCLDSLIFAFSIRSFKKSIFRKDIFSNIYLTAGVGISAFLLFCAIYFPPLQNMLQTQSLSFSDWVCLVAISFVEILLIEISKRQIFKKN